MSQQTIELFSTFFLETFLWKKLTRSEGLGPRNPRAHVLPGPLEFFVDGCATRRRTGYKVVRFRHLRDIVKKREWHLCGSLSEFLHRGAGDRRRTIKPGSSRRPIRVQRTFFMCARVRPRTEFGRGERKVPGNLARHAHAPALVIVPPFRR